MMETSRQSGDVARTIFQMLVLAALIVTALWIVRPFLIALVWAATITIATWPLLLQVQSLLGGKRSLAVAVMTTLSLMVLVVPLYFAVTMIGENVEELEGLSKSTMKWVLSGPPAWVSAIPLAGQRLAAGWHQLAAARSDEIRAYLTPFARTLALWFLGQVGSLGLLLVQFLLTVILTGILYANGETAADGIERFMLRLAGPEGAKALHLAAMAVRSVALGIVITALVQSRLSGTGLAIAGVPFAMLLTALMFMLAIVQIGPAPVLIGSVIWVYSTSSVTSGTVFLLWAIFCTSLDNFLRPLLIRRGANLPLLLIFAGVIGGLIAFGVIGLFIGPVVLAVTYTLLVDWVSEDEAAAVSVDP